MILTFVISSHFLLSLRLNLTHRFLPKRFHYCELVSVFTLSYKPPSCKVHTPYRLNLWDSVFIRIT